ncbi:serine/threonine protein kinase [Actinomadura sp. KC06]|uniref:serine/threonine-protein kinase n=1 Tax=Actinomadura sp. KC06 TaxID=2530369 RepID=UPI00104CC151|nr:serine/threonine-protein kinase [Actinomadura sp. KC06]TDD29247.1 serine/threonine protein kinase [Actinomadura sp. KC06]
MQALEPHDPRTVGRCRILARIGAGGMAMIYFGRSWSGRPVAVKLMHAEFAREPEYRERFRHEVAATRTVSGRYSPGVLDADPDAALPWLATQFLPSVSLREAVGLLGRLPSDLVFPLAAGVVEALASVHGAGIVHLDLKPANILLTADGPRLIDFGIAADLPPAAARDAAPDAAPAAAPGAAPGGREPAGTWGFMSPEQASGGPVTAASDVYSLGATLAYACTGRAPSGEEMDGITDDRLRTLISGCLRPDPSSRPTVPELAAALAFASAEDQSALQLPPALTAEIDRRTSEAANPPVPIPPPASTPTPAASTPTPNKSVPFLGRIVRRRTMALSGGACAAALALAFAIPLALSPDDGPETATAEPSGSASTSSTAPASAPTTRTLEFYIFGTSTLRSLTTTVNGESVTVRNKRLPYRRVVQIPPEPQRVTWRIDYRFGAGTYVTKVIVDGTERSSAGGSSASKDVSDSYNGAV